jgi:hypothetical protein
MINWHLFSKAITAYTHLGYQLIEVPWLVDQQAIDVTLPPGATPFTVNGCGELNQLVGSAEQSFVYLALQDKLLPGKYQALTPCFRDDKEDELHHKYFMKLELIEINKLSNKGWNPVMSSWQVIRDAEKVLSQFTSKIIEVLDTDQGADLTIDGIEIGSYGVRNYKGISWVYGTGLAEPRFSKVNGL